MRIAQLALCVALVLPAACSHEVAHPVGVTNIQPDPGLLGDQGGSALTAAATSLNQLEEARGLTEDPVTREALTWEIRGLQSRMNRVADGMTPGKRAPTWMLRGEIDALSAEVQRATRAEAWAMDQIRSTPSTGSAGGSPTPAPVPAR